MSKLDAIQEYANSSTARRPATGNFALRVSGYTQDDQGRDAVTGVRLDTGETVTVVLRPYQGPLKAPRAEVKDFTLQRGEILDFSARRFERPLVWPQYDRDGFARVQTHAGDCVAALIVLRITRYAQCKIPGCGPPGCAAVRVFLDRVQF